MNIWNIQANNYQILIMTDLTTAYQAFQCGIKIITSLPALTDEIWLAYRRSILIHHPAMFRLACPLLPR